MLKISKAQVAHLISVPLVAGLTVGTAWLAKHFPGLPQFNTEEVTVFAGVVGVFGAGVALHYLKGLREWQLLEAKGIISTDEVEAPLDSRLIGTPVSPPSGTSNLGDAGKGKKIPAGTP